MSSIFFPGSEDLVSDSNAQECGQQPFAKLTPSAGKSSPIIGPACPCMTTFGNSTGNSTPEQLTLFAEDFPVRTYPSGTLGVKPKASTEKEAASGGNTHASSRKSSHAGSSSKTSLPYALADWSASFKTSTRSGTWANGMSYPQPPLVPSTSGKGSGLLPTPRASEWKGCGPKGSKSHSHWLSHFYLSAVVTDSGKLNPTFAERMMGFPTGWTACEPSATQLSLKSPNSSGEPSSPTSRITD